ncbi:MAG: hypothetical protein B6U86_03380 [Candidatus Altiarchaeales archaeon ex4484_43]|nr:MAG: hypothetical protein B6U86_03380 [Candidatus Altiarchaeales archaeon ex4484_43]
MDGKTNLGGFYVEGKHNPRILLVSEYFPPRIFGGGELSAYALAKGLAGKELNVSILTSKFRGLEGFELRDGFKIYRLMETGDKPDSLLSKFKRKNTFPKSEEETLDYFGKKFELIHCLNNTSMVGCKTDVQTIATLDSYSAFCPKGNLFYKEMKECTGCNFSKFISCILKSEYMAGMRLRFYLKYNPLFWVLVYADYLRRRDSLKNIKKFIVVNDSLRRLLVKNNIKEKDITKIPHLMTLDDKTIKEYPLEEGTVNITYIGTLNKINGVDLLIKAFNQLRGGNLRLLIVGGGPERRELEKISGPHVRFLGELDHETMPCIYKKSDIIVIPSRWPDPLSRVMLEAAYFKKPIVATNVGGNSEGVVDGRNGFLVKPDEIEIRDGLKRLLENPSLREGMGGASGKIFRERFDGGKIIEEILNVYQMK